MSEEMLVRLGGVVGTFSFSLRRWVSSRSSEGTEVENENLATFEDDMLNSIRGGPDLAADIRECSKVLEPEQI